MEVVSEYKNGDWVESTVPLHDYIRLDEEISITPNSSIYIGFYHPEKVQVTVKEIGRTDKKDRFIQNELNVLTRLTPHPNISRYYAAYRTDKKAYIVLEYVPGCDLTEELYYENCTLEDVKCLARSMISAIKHIHQHEIAHMDIKSENIIFNTQDNKYKLIDFGLAYYEGGLTEGDGGTLEYIPSYDWNKILVPDLPPSSMDLYYLRDVWALGITLYCCCNSYRPYLCEEIVNWIHRPLIYEKPVLVPQCKLTGSDQDDMVQLITACCKEDVTERSDIFQIEKLTSTWL